MNPNQKISNHLKIIVLILAMMTCASAMEVRYKMVFFGTGIREAYEALYGVLPDTEVVIK